MRNPNVTGTNPTNPSLRILLPLPDRDFDPTECAIPWKACTRRGWTVTVSTEHGDVAEGDPNKLKGPLPGLLSAGAQARAAYREMTQDLAYRHPIPYAEIDPDLYQAVLLPGGDAPPVRQYLESEVLQNKVLQFSRQGKLIGAICHGVLVPARTIDPQTGRSILYGHKVTAVTASLDRTGYLLCRLARRGYIMYPRCVADEVRACLERPEDFSTGRSVWVPYVVADGNVVTSRWYMDAPLFAEKFVQALERSTQAENSIA